MEIALVLGLLVMVLVLFATEKLSVDIITIIMLIILILTKIITPEEAFAGFSSDFIVILSSIFVISGTLMETGVLDDIGARMVRIISKKRNSLMFLVTGFPGILSAFMNNTTVTAIFIGPFLGLSKKLGISPSKILMPLAFMSIIGGTVTLIGTSTNVAVSSALPQYGLPTLNMFSFSHIGLILFVTGAAYIIFVSKFFVPARQKPEALEDDEGRTYMSEILIREGGSLIGQKVQDSKLQKKDVKVLSVLRDNKRIRIDADSTFKEKDLVLISCTMGSLMKLKESDGVAIRADILHGDGDGKVVNGFQIAEVLVTPNSSLVKTIIKESRLRSRYGVEVLAVHRMDQELTTRLEDFCVQTGDLLLVQGEKDRIKALHEENDFLVLDDFKPNLYKEKKGYIALGIFMAAVIVGSIELIPLAVAFMMATLIIILLGIIRPERAYQLIDWRMLILIGGMSAFGTAMKKSGASEFLADLIVKVFEPMGVYVILAAFVVLVVILTQPMSNAAAALVVLPIAIETAQQLGVNPVTFAIAIMLGASVSLVAPLEPACILVYGPGKYKFRDFIKVGTPITLLLIAEIVFFCPVFWPL